MSDSASESDFMAEPAATTAEAFAYTSTLDLAEAAQRLRHAGSSLVTAHAKPDGDAIGSVIALTAYLRRLGIDACGVMMPPVPAAFDHLRGRDLVETFDPDTPLPERDLVVVLDTGAWAQVEPMGDYLETRLGKTLILDHHLSGDIDAPRHIDTSAAACCEIVADLIDAMVGLDSGAPGAPGQADGADPLADPAIAEALYLGVTADTGWFRFSNTTPRTHQLAARLLATGLDHTAMFAKIEQSERLEKLRLTERALRHLRLVAGGRAAVMVLRTEDFLETGARSEETGGLVDLPRAVVGVEVSVVVSQPPAEANGNGKGNGTSGGNLPGAGVVRLSFRSKSGPEAVDVTELAGRFGGGGHARAAGAKVDAPLDEVLPRVVEALESALGENGPRG